MTRTNSYTDWRGYFAATITPFNNDFSIDEAGFKTILGWLLEEGMHGIVVAGTTGEWPSLDAEERIRLFRLAREIVPAHIPLLAGTSAINIKETLRLVQHCEDLQMDGVLLTIPPYIHPTDDEVVGFYVEVARRCRLPMVVYNWPSGTGRDLNVDVLSRLSAVDTIVAIKNSTPNLPAFIDALRRLKHRFKIFGIMPGDLGLGLLQHIGGDGCIGASGALGRAQPGFFDAAFRGDHAEALALGRLDQALMAELFDGFVGRYGHAIATIKELMRLRGLPAGIVRPPLMGLDDAGRARVLDYLRRYGVRNVP